jgi:5-methylcytosine-specific restriction endonuclease McrA
MKRTDLRAATAAKNPGVFNSLDKSRKRKHQASKGESQKRNTCLKKVGRRGKKNRVTDQKDRENLNVRTEGMCERCGRPGDHLHHVLPKSHHPEFRDVPANHLKVCMECHEWFEANRTLGWDWFCRNRNDDALAIDLPGKLGLAMFRRRAA